MKRITEQQWWRMRDVNLSEPVPLGEADLSRSFVYDRDYGVMYCPFGYHQAAMSLLLAFAHDCATGPEVAEKLGLRYSAETADKWLESRPGAAYKSSQSTKIRAGRRGTFTAIERRFFTDVEYQFADQN